MSYIANWLNTTDREIRRSGDRHSAWLRRRYDAPLEEVWKACTGRVRLGRWFGKVRGEFREGGVVEIDTGMDDTVTARILRCEPYCRLVLAWTYAANPFDPADEVELRMSSDGGGTILELQHRSVDESAWWVGIGPSWEDWLMRLDVLLQGDDPAEVSSQEIQPQLELRWVLLREPEWTGLSMH